MYEYIMITENTPEEECKYCCSTEGDVRLKHGRSGRASEGYVEVCVEGVWSTLCDDNWDNRDAGVICSMLGYHRESEYNYLHWYRH